MKRAGIICEFNPFHSGHAYLLQKVREAGADEIVCLMSEYFVQRGEPAIMPARERALCALASGADSVFALPFPYSAGSAEFFAEAGVYILSSLGCDTIAFGSESGDVDALMNEAKKAKCKPASNEGTASALSNLSPNDILGVEYIRAGLIINPSLEYFTVKREGAGHDSSAMEGLTISSSFAREQMKAGIIPTGLTEKCEELIRDCITEGTCPTSSKTIGSAEFTAFRMSAPDAFEDCAECGGGVAQRLADCARRAANFEEMMKLASTKKYTDARLRRAALFGLCGVKSSDLKSRPAYVRLIAFSGESAGKTGETVNKSSIPVVSNVRNVPDGEKAERQFALEQTAEALFSLGLPVPRKCGTLVSKSTQKV